MHRGVALAGFGSEHHGSTGARSVFDARLFFSSSRPGRGRTRHLGALSAASVLGDGGRRRLRVSVALSVQKGRCRAHRRLRLPKVQVWLLSMACCAEDGVEAARACRVLQQPIQSKFGIVARSQCGWGAASLLCTLLGALGSRLDSCLGSFRTRGRTKMKNANERFFDGQNVDSGCLLHVSSAQHVSSTRRPRKDIVGSEKSSATANEVAIVQ
jgi:hypothetical protein